MPELTRRSFVALGGAASSPLRGGALPAAFARGGAARELDVRQFGAVGDGRHDDTRAIQAAIDHAGRQGGGTVVVPAGSYLCNTVGEADGCNWILCLCQDDTQLYLARDAVIRTTAPASLFTIGGHNKPEGPTRWQRHDIHLREVHAMHPAAKGAGEVTLSSPADTAAFAPGDWVYIRTGQIFGGTYLGHPYAEWNRVTAVDPVRGRLLLAYPLRKEYRAETYPADHVRAGQPAPLGVTNATRPVDILSKNVGILGEGTLVLDHPASVLTGNQMVGFREEGITVRTAGHHQNMGCSLSRIADLRIFLSGVETLGWALSVDKGNDDTIWEDIVIELRGVAQLHIHEGCSVTARNLKIANANQKGIDCNVVSVRARAHDVHLTNIEIVGTPMSPNYPAIFVDGSCDGGEIDDVSVVGTPGAGCAALSLYGTNFALGLIRTALPVNVASNRILAAGSVEAFVPASALSLVRGPAVRQLSAQDVEAWVLPATGSSVLSFPFCPFPGWWGADLLLLLSHLSPDAAGSVAFGVGGTRMAAGRGADAAARFSYGTGSIELGFPKDTLARLELRGGWIDWRGADMVTIAVSRDIPAGEAHFAAPLWLFGVILRRRG